MADSFINPLLPVTPVGSVLKRKKRQPKPAKEQPQAEQPQEIGQDDLSVDDEQAPADKPKGIDTYA